MLRKKKLCYLFNGVVLHNGKSKVTKHVTKHFIFEAKGASWLKIKIAVQ